MTYFGAKIVTCHTIRRYFQIAFILARKLLLINFKSAQKSSLEFYTNNHDLLIQKRAHCFFHTVKKSQIVSKNSIFRKKDKNFWALTAIRI